MLLLLSARLLPSPGLCLVGWDRWSISVRSSTLMVSIVIVVMLLMVFAVLMTKMVWLS